MTLEEFDSIAESAFEATFGYARPSKMNRYSFVLLAESDEGKPMGYMACIETSDQDVWILHGGAFPPHRKSMDAVRGFHLMTNYLRESYSTARIDTETWNLPVIKLAYSAGFQIVGVENQDGAMYVNLKAVFR